MARRRHLLLLTAVAGALLLLVLVPRSSAPTEAPTPKPPTSARLLPPEPFPAPPPDEDTVPTIELYEPSRLRGVSASCRDPAVMDHHFAPPAAVTDGAWSDRLGSKAVHIARNLYVDRNLRRRLDDWGLTPAWVGTQLAQVSPWLALAALDEERMWNRGRTNQVRGAFREQFGISPYDDEARQLRAEDSHAASWPVDADRTPALQLADALSGSDDVGLRARLYRVRVLQEQATHPDLPSEECRTAMQDADREALALLHDADDPDLLASVAASLVWSFVETTPADDARILEVMELLPPNLGRHLALRRMVRAYQRGDEQAGRFWWEQYQPVVAYCEGVPAAEREQEGCWCVQMMADENGAYFHHVDGTQPRTLRERIALGGARCRQAGHYPDDHDVDPTSDFGHCLQEQLGDDIVLGRDVNVRYEYISPYE